MLHGGEIYNFIEMKHDFSVNINPLGIPESAYRSLRENLSLLVQYPDQESIELRLALEKNTGIPASQIVCGNGASALIEAAVRGVGARSILLTAPSFSGYKHAADGCGAEIRYHTLRREEDFVLTDRYLEDLALCPDLAILCSPSNPVGNQVDPALMSQIVEMCERQGTWLMVDECFQGFVPDCEQRTMRQYFLSDRKKEDSAAVHDGNDTENGSGKTGETQSGKTAGNSSGNNIENSSGKTAETQSKAGYKRLLVLDAFTKRYAMPGIRLGYLMTGDSAIARIIHAQQPEWSVSLPAQIAGLAALKAGSGYMDTARAMVAAERKKMEEALVTLGCRVYPGEANYIFFSTDTELYEPLLARGILIRNCDNYVGLRKGDYRVAVMTPEENDILLLAIADIICGKLSEE